MVRSDLGSNLHTLIELGEDFPVDYYKQIKSDIKILWDMYYYDGPLSGVCRYNNKNCWFEVAAGDVDVRLIYALLEMTNDQFNYETYWHKLFNVCDQDENMLKFYYYRANSHKPLVFMENQILGWFTDEYLCFR